MDWRLFLLPLSLLLLAPGIRGEGPVDRLCCRYNGGHFVTMEMILEVGTRAYFSADSE